MLKRGRYTFHEAILDDDHFVRRYLRYAFEQTSSPADYHEAFGLFLLSIASAGLKIKMAHLPFGMRANIFLLSYGETFRSRKSTAMDYCEDIITQVFPGVILPGDFSPQGLAEQVSARDFGPCVMLSDEFHKVISQIHNVKWMTGLREFFLTMYSKGTYHYAKSSKGGKTKVNDEVLVEDCHLCVAGNVTPAIQRTLREEDVETGFLNRFGFVAPKNRPPPIPFAQLRTPNKAKRTQIALYLSDIRKAVEDLVANKKTDILFENDALALLDNFQDEVDKTYPEERMISMAARSIDYAMKISALVALGAVKPINLVKPPLVKEMHVKMAIEIVRRWARSGVEIVSGMVENESESIVNKIANELKKLEVVYRTDVARRFRMQKYQLDSIRDTMIDRGLVKVFYVRKPNSRKDSEVWGKPDLGEEEIKVDDIAS